MSENQHTCTSWRLAYENERKRADALAEEVKVLHLHLRAHGVDVRTVTPRHSDPVDATEELNRLREALE